MKLLVAAVGRLKAGAERELCARYLARAVALGPSVGLSELLVRETPESRAARPPDRQREEALALRTSLPTGAWIIALDERGRSLSSLDFARDIRAARDAGAPLYALMIGGSDGLDPELCKMARNVISFGAMTWPHQMVRVMILEQIYRSATILAGHPYHRA